MDFFKSCSYRRIELAESYHEFYGPITIIADIGYGCDEIN